MPGLTGVSNQSPRVTAGYLNICNDPAPGVPLSSPSGSIVQPYYGQVGAKLWLSEDDAYKLTYLPYRSVSGNVVAAIQPPATTVSSTVGSPLFGGVYMYVKFASGMLAANLGPGRLVAWDLTVAPDLYQVYTPLTADNNNMPLLAGVTINPLAAQTGNTLNTANIATPGNYGWIQISGRCLLQLTSQAVTATKQDVVIWSRSATAGDLGSVNFMANTATYGTAFGSAVVPGSSSPSLVPISDYVGITETGTAALVGTSSLYIIVNVPFGRFAWRE